MLTVSQNAHCVLKIHQMKSASMGILCAKMKNDWESLPTKGQCLPSGPGCVLKECTCLIPGWWVSDVPYSKSETDDWDWGVSLFNKQTLIQSYSLCPNHPTSTSKSKHLSVNFPDKSSAFSCQQAGILSVPEVWLPSNQSPSSQMFPLPFQSLNSSSPKFFREFGWSHHSHW